MTTARIAEIGAEFWMDESGVTSIEYALLAALIFGAIVISVGLLGDGLVVLFQDVADKISDAVS